MHAYILAIIPGLMQMCSTVPLNCAEDGLSGGTHLHFIVDQS